MYTLQRDNVVKMTDSEVKRDKYLAEGYHLVVEDNPAAEGEPEEDNQPKQTKKKA